MHGLPHGLSIHVASPEERLAAYRNIHPTWGQGLALDEFLERRLRSVQHNRAQTWVLTVDGAVVSSLARYPLALCWRGAVTSAFGIGAVHTVPEQRGKGFARTLCEEVAARAIDENRRVGILFSDIDPQYYAAMGFHVCGDVAFRCDRIRDLAEREGGVDVEPIHPQSHLPSLDVLYRKGHAADDLFLWRDLEYWSYSLQKCPKDKFFLVRSGGVEAAYLRMRESADGQAEIIEFLLDPAHGTLEEAALAAAARIAHDWESTRLTGWLRPTPAVLAWFKSSRRQREIPMVRSWSDGVPLDAWSPSIQRHFWRSDQF